MKNNDIKKEDVIFKRLVLEYPFLSQHPISKLNWQIFKYFNLYCEDQAILATSLIQNPFGKTSDLKNIKKKFGTDVSNVLTVLNFIQGSDNQKKGRVLKNLNGWKNIIILYLVNYVIFFENRQNHKKNTIFDRKKIRFALKLLENLDVSEIRTKLEDSFFSILHPEIYNNYHSLLQFTRKKYLLKQEKIIQEFQRVLKKAKIKGVIESRLKTIYSIHNKIMKKNILLSQVLDTIGMRIIVNTEEDCYKSMVLILKKSSIMTSMVKDYIAIPKNNGYQSIHLTIFYDDFPVEIQIRTREMDKFAQYGSASHLEYKKKERL